MVDINNSEYVNGMTTELGLQSLQGLPTSLNPNVQPVFEIRRKFTDIMIHGASTTTTGITLYTTPTNQDFYLTFLSAAYIKDVVCDNTAVYVQFYVNGAARQIIFPVYPTQAGTAMKDITFSSPIKLQRGTAVTMSGSFGAGTLTKVVTIAGYLI
jgi:hypothetical protein